MVCESTSNLIHFGIVQVEAICGKRRSDLRLLGLLLPGGPSRHYEFQQPTGAEQRGEDRPKRAQPLKRRGRYSERCLPDDRDRHVAPPEVELQRRIIDYGVRSRVDPWVRFVFGGGPSRAVDAATRVKIRLEIPVAARERDPGGMVRKLLPEPFR